jgi:hypothetical protein
MRRNTPPIIEDGGLLPVIKIGIDTPIVSGAHCCVGPWGLLSRRLSIGPVLERLWMGKTGWLVSSLGLTFRFRVIW